MSKRILATARVRVTMDVACDVVWPADYPVGKLHDEAVDNALNTLRRAFEAARGSGETAVTFIDMVPTAILTSAKEK